MRLNRGAGVSELLERDVDLAALAQLVSRAGGRSGQLVVIEGPAGIGKTSLLARGADLAAAAGTRVLSVRCRELERDHPFGVVRQLLERVGDPADSQGAADGEDEPDLRMTGDLARVLEPGEGSDGGNVSYALLHRLYWWVVTVAGSGLTICIDDLQYCDRPSLRFLAFLVARIADHPILIMASLRSSDIGTDAHLLTTLLRDPAAISIRPKPLSRAAVATLIEEVLDAHPEDAFTEACYHATGGNPELLTELLRVVRQERVRPTASSARTITDIGPGAVVRSVLLRLLPLSEPSIRVARALAVLGETAPTAAVAALAEVSDGQVGDATRKLIKADILAADPIRHVSFVHPLVRDVVYRDLTPAEREELHRDSAEWLRRHGAPIEQVVAHLLVVPPRGQAWVSATLRAAAELALARSAPESAVTYLRRALLEPLEPAERVAVLRELGGAEMLVDEAAAAEHLAAAYAAESDPLIRATIAAQLSRMLIFIGPPGNASAIAAQASSELPESLVDERRSLLALELYARHFGSPGPGAADALPSSPDELAGDGPGRRMLLATAAWSRSLAGGPGHACLALARAALEGGSLIQVDPGFMGIVATGVLALADADDAVTGWEEALAIAQRTGSLFAVTGLHLWQGWTWLQRGELLEAEALLRLAIDETERYNVEGDAGLAYACGFLARVLLERGDAAGASAALERTPRPVAGSDADVAYSRGRIELLLRQNRFAEALSTAEGVERRLGHIANPAWLPWRTLKTLAAAGLHRPQLTVGLLDIELDHARRWGAPGALAAALRHSGEQRGAAGVDLLHEAVEVASGSPVRLEHAKALVALGAALRRGGRRTESRAPLHQAVDIAAQVGATPLLEFARTELLAAGGRRTGTTLKGVRSLTPSERRVSELAATGMSNRDIARTLYVTTKTVEVHLSSSYRKLGIKTRAQLPTDLGAGAAGRQGSSGDG